MSRRGTILFAAMCVIWGLPYLLIKVAVRDLTPATLVFFRTAIGATILVPIALARGELRPVLTRWRPLVAYTVVELAIPWVLLSTAEKKLPSSLSGLLVAAVPLVGALMAWSIHDREALGRRGVLGLFVGLAGVAALVGFDVTGANAGSVALVAFVVLGVVFLHESFGAGTAIGFALILIGSVMATGAGRARRVVPALEVAEP